MFSDPLDYFVLLAAVLIGQLLMLFYFGTWLKRFPDTVLKKYSMKVRILCTLPIPIEWSKYINIEDVPTFFRYREAFLLMFNFVLTTILLTFILVAFISYKIIIQGIQ